MMDFGIPCMSMVSKSLDSEIKEMHISLENGTQIQMKAMPMRESMAYVITMLTYEQPVWVTMVAGETPDLALSALCRMVGATDTVLQGDTE
jgi:6-phosphogluconate dehydrogenase (decarboxylating)